MISTPSVSGNLTHARITNELTLQENGVIVRTNVLAIPYSEDIVLAKYLRYMFVAIRVLWRGLLFVLAIPEKCPRHLVVNFGDSNLNF